MACRVLAPRRRPPGPIRKPHIGRRSREDRGGYRRQGPTSHAAAIRDRRALRCRNGGMVPVSSGDAETGLARRSINRRPGALIPCVPSDAVAMNRIADSGMGPVSRVAQVHTALRKRSFEVGNQVLISNHRKLLWSKAMVVNVAEKPQQDSGRYN